MSEITDLLEKTQDSNKKERQHAVKELGDLDKKYPPVIEKLEDLQNNDPDKGVRKEAEKSLKKLKDKPLEEAIAKEEAGIDGTGFDDEVGDSDLDPGEYDMESSLTKEEEDRREDLAAGKGLMVSLIENNIVTMNYFGEVGEKQQSKGSITVANTGSTNRISGVDLVLTGLEEITPEDNLSEKTSIGLLVPGRDNDWKVNYTFEQDFSPIKVEQTYEDPESGLSPNFATGEEINFEAKIVITNVTNEPVFGVKGKKIVNELARISDSQSSSGTVSETEDGFSFEIEEIPTGESVTITVNLRASLPEDVPSYQSGELKITYENRDKLASGLNFVSIDGVSDVRRRIRRRQRETEPSFYDAEIIFENKSEFVYELNKFTVFADSIDSQQIVLDWDGSQATEDEREIVPGEKVNFEFVYESFEGPPSFGDYVEFSVQSEVKWLTQTTVILPAEDLKFMALEITKSFMLEGQPVNKFELPSYVETEVPILLTIKGIGPYPLEGLVIRDEIPEGFKAPESEQISITKGEVPLSESIYSTSVEPGSLGGQELVINIDHLEETPEGGLKENEIIAIKYINVASNPEPRDDTIQSQAHCEGFIYVSPDSKVQASSTVEDLEMIVIHERDDIDIGKMIESLDYEGKNAYRIHLEAENYGSSVATFFIEDLIPNGFIFIDDSVKFEPEAEILEPKSISNGTIRGWKFSNIQPNDEVSASYLVVEDSPEADPRKLQSVYRG